MRIICLGDSLTRGYGVRAGEDYPAQLGLLLATRGRTVEIANCGKDGETSGELLKRIATIRDFSTPGDIVLLLIGTNDALSLRLPIEQYEKNLTELIEALLLAQLYIVIATLPPVEMAYFYGDDTNRRLHMYNESIRKLACLYNLPLVELANIDQGLTTDGVHFGAAGYHKMAEHWALGLMKHFSYRINFSL